MRKTARLALTMALALAMFGAISTAGAAEVAGEVTGFVNFVQGTGVRLDGACTAQSYEFDDVVLRGAMRQGNNSFVGEIVTDRVTGGANTCDTLSSGAGKVASATTPAVFKGSGAGTTNLLSGTFYGTYKRTESFVEVSLTASICFGSQAVYQGGACPTAPAPATILVRAQFTPSKTDQAGTKVIQALFTGEFSTF